MKRKTKILTVSSAALLSASAIAPAVLLTSCKNDDESNKQEDAMVQPLKKEIIDQFKGIATVNRPSNDPANSEETNLQSIREYIHDKATEFGIEDINEQEDKLTDKEGKKWLAEGNIMFDIPATKGYEDKIPTIILQAHMDLVYVNVDDGWEDPETGEIINKHNYKIVLEETTDEKGEPIIQSKGNKTTIGADDGIGMATMLALAKHRDEFTHGKIRCIFTTDEETGLFGAQQVPCGREETDTLKADTENWFLENYKEIKESKENPYIKYLLNLDWEDMNTLATASNGGVAANAWRDFDKSTEIATVPTGYTAYELKATGYAGGHSGLDYNNNHSNPFASLFKVMQSQLADSYYVNYDKYDLLLNFITSDSKAFNKIPTTCTLIFFLKDSLFGEDQLKAFTDALAKVQEEARAHCADDKNATLTFNKMTESVPTKALTNTASNNVLGYLGQLGVGVFIPESAVGYHSSSNVAPVELSLEDPATANDHHLRVSLLARSFDKQILDYLGYTADALFQLFLYKEGSSNYEQTSKYEPWFPKGDNPMLDLLKAGYKKTDIIPKEILVGGGIENSYWHKASPTTSMGTIGATLRAVHSENEAVYLNSLNPYLQVLLYTIKNLK